MFFYKMGMTAKKISQAITIKATCTTRKSSITRLPNSVQRYNNWVQWWNWNVINTCKSDDVPFNVLAAAPRSICCLPPDLRFVDVIFSVLVVSVLSWYVYSSLLLSLNSKSSSPYLLLWSVSSLKSVQK